MLPDLIKNELVNSKWKIKMARPSTRGGKRISVRLAEDAEEGLGLLMGKFDADCSDTVNKVLIMASRKLKEERQSSKSSSRSRAR